MQILQRFVKADENLWTHDWCVCYVVDEDVTERGAIKGEGLYVGESLHHFEVVAQEGVEAFWIVDPLRVCFSTCDKLLLKVFGVFSVTDKVIVSTGPEFEVNVLWKAHQAIVACILE